jgi:hypothetical protein
VGESGLPTSTASDHPKPTSAPAAERPTQARKDHATMLTTTALAIILFSAADSPAAATVATAAGSSAPHAVTVGVFINQINALNLHDNTFTVDANVWFRWKNDDINPLETFELANGRIDVREKEYRSKLGDENYATCRIIATVTEFWDLSAFPLDNHVLELAIEVQVEDHKIRFVPDIENSALNPAVQVPGWSIGTPQAGVMQNVYATNYGDTSLSTGHESSYSRFVFSIPVKRPGYGYCFKLLIGLVVATALAFGMFYVRPSDDPRFNLGVGAIFAVVASEYIVAACLPATHVFTLADALHVLGLLTIFAAIAESIVALRLERVERLAAAKTLDRWSRLALGAIFSGACSTIFIVFCRGG